MTVLTIRLRPCDCRFRTSNRVPGLNGYRWFIEPPRMGYAFTLRSHEYRLLFLL